MYITQIDILWCIKGQKTLALVRLYMLLVLIRLKAHGLGIFSFGKLSHLSKFVAPPNVASKAFFSLLLLLPYLVLGANGKMSSHRLMIISWTFGGKTIEFSFKDFYSLLGTTTFLLHLSILIFASTGPAKIKVGSNRRLVSPLSFLSFFSEN